MHILPKFTKLYRSKAPGVVQANTKNGTYMRAHNIPVDPRTPKRIGWRHIFGTSRANWAGIGPNGQNNAPIDFVDPQVTWEVENGLAFTQVTLGPIDGGVELDNVLANLPNGFAYQTQVNSTLVLLGLPARAATLMTTAYPTCTAGSTDTNAVGTATASAVHWPSVLGTLIGVGDMTLTSTYNGTVLPESTSVSTDPDIYVQIRWQYPTALNQQLTTVSSTPTVGMSVTLVLGSIASSITTSDIIYAQPPDQTEGPVGPCTITSVGSQIVTFTVPDGYNVPDLTYTFTLVTPGSSGTAQAYVRMSALWPPTAGDYSVTITTTLEGQTWTNVLDVSITTNASQAVTPPPTYAVPRSMRVVTALDSNLNVIGFGLFVGLLDTSQFMASRSGNGMAPRWQVSASPVYTSTYSTPSASTYKALSNNGPVGNNSVAGFQGWSEYADDLLAKWISIFGALPAKGYIKFVVNPVDLLTGVPGPALGATASFEQGTFLGSVRGDWKGNNWLGQELTPMAVISSVSGSNPYTIECDAPDAFEAGFTGSVYVPAAGVSQAVAVPSYTYNSATSITFTVAGGSPPPVVGSSFFVIYEQTGTKAPGSVQVLILIRPAINTGQPTTGNPWSTPVNQWPGEYDFPRTLTPSLAAASVVPNGLNNKSFHLPPGMTATFEPATLTFTSSSGATQATIMTVTCDETCPDNEVADGADPGIYGYTASVKITDGVYTNTYPIAITVKNPSVPMPPANWLTIGGVAYDLGFISPSTNVFEVTLTNTGPSDIPCQMTATSTSILSATAAQLVATPFSVTWDNPAPTVPAAVTTVIDTFPAAYPMNGGGSDPVESFFTTADTIIGDLTGYYITVTGCEPAGFNGGPWEITATSGETVEIASTANPGTMTTVGTATITNPSGLTPDPTPKVVSTTNGTVVLTCTVIVPSNFDTDAVNTNLIASAGKNTTYTSVH